MRAVIFANGTMEKPNLMASLIKPDDLLIAADGGLHHIRRLGLVPQVIIGDLDSVTTRDLEWLKDREVEIRQFPAEKDFTDLELAIRLACERECSPIMLATALGGRMDQAQANIALLSLPEFAQYDIYLDDGLTAIRQIKDSLTIEGRAGDTISLLPLCGPAVGVHTQRLKYPLNYETLTPGQTRGISNVMLADSAQVSLQEGRLLCMHLRQNR